MDAQIYQPEVLQSRRDFRTTIQRHYPLSILSGSLAQALTVQSFWAKYLVETVRFQMVMLSSASSLSSKPLMKRDSL